MDKLTRLELFTNESSYRPLLNNKDLDPDSDYFIPRVKRL